MKIKINGTEWTIKIVDEATINNEMKADGTLGCTIYKTQEILLLKDQANIIKTLKHELTHVWLYEYGHSGNDNATYNCEDICEIVASINDFINKIITHYMTDQRISSESIVSKINQTPYETKIQLCGKDITIYE